MKIEVCCGSYIDALESYWGGADRVELCSNIYFGGLTPTIGALDLLKEKTDIQCSVMIRPREGGFCYSDEEFELMQRDAKVFIDHGADSIVFGFLHSDGTIDYEKCKAMCQLANGKCKTVFHKAFDVSTSPMIEAARELRKIGVSRILTAGKEKTALDGAENISELIGLGGIEILPAGSIRVHNIQELHKKTGCEWVHTSAFEDCVDKSAENDSILFTSTQIQKQGVYKKVNSEIVRNIKEFSRNKL